jgi:hypothetical protein
MQIDRIGVKTVLIAAVLATGAQAEQPLSAIDWLSQSVAAPPQGGTATPPAGQPATATRGPVTENVSVSVIGGTSANATGLLPPQVTGLPPALWGLGKTSDIVAAIGRERLQTLPSLRGLLLTILLAESEPPADAGPGNAVLIARVDKLLDLGALDQARALIDAAAVTADPELFRRSFDVDLLTGNEDAGCKTMVASPGLAPTFPARIFCLARSGDWNAAALTLRTAQALGYVTEDEDALLSRFLDPDLYEGDPPLPVPERITPLAWRMFEAIGEPLPTNTLPLAFAHAELRPAAGWKAQIEAAERLARAGALPANVLLGLYTERKPAASGGVWDRVAAFRAFDAAMASEDATAIARALPPVWDQMTEAELEVPFAELYGQSLQAITLEGEAADIAFDIGLLSPAYTGIAVSYEGDTAQSAFLLGLAKGDLTGITAPDTLGRAITPAFAGADLTPAQTVLLADNRLGEAILSAIEAIETGLQGDLDGVTEGLTLLRRVGLDGVARRTALELMLLERRG